MPKGAYLRSMFIKHFIAKTFHWTPDVLERINADDLDMLVMIEHEMNTKTRHEHDVEAQKMRASSR